MGFINADIIKQDDDYVWKGDKNLSIYESQFEKQLIQRVNLFRKAYQTIEQGWVPV